MQERLDCGASRRFRAAHGEGRGGAGVGNPARLARQAYAVVFGATKCDEDGLYSPVRAKPAAVRADDTLPFYVAVSLSAALHAYSII